METSGVGKSLPRGGISVDSEVPDFGLKNFAPDGCFRQVWGWPLCRLKLGVKYCACEADASSSCTSRTAGKCFHSDPEVIRKMIACFIEHKKPLWTGVHMFNSLPS